MPNSNPACRPPLSVCGECFGPVADTPFFLYLSGPHPYENEVLPRLDGVGYYWSGDTFTFACEYDCRIILSDAINYQYKDCADGSCSPIQYNFELAIGSFSISETPPE